MLEFSSDHCIMIYESPSLLQERCVVSQPPSEAPETATLPQLSPRLGGQLFGADEASFEAEQPARCTHAHAQHSAAAPCPGQLTASLARRQTCRGSHNCLFQATIRYVGTPPTGCLVQSLHRSSFEVGPPRGTGLAPPPGAPLPLGGDRCSDNVRALAAGGTARQYRAEPINAVNTVAGCVQGQETRTRRGHGGPSAQGRANAQMPHRPPYVRGAPAAHTCKLSIRNRFIIRRPWG